MDESGLLNEEIVEQDESIFNVENTYGTTCTVKEMGIRHFILRQNPRPGELADWINQLNMVAEGTGHALPVMVLSNSRNEHGEIVFGMNDEAGVFATWPGTMGIAAAVRGNGPELIDSFARCIRMEWDAVGMKKGYMYMADVMTDPRWQRSYGIFGEDPELVCAIMERLIPGIQGSSQGVTREGGGWPSPSSISREAEPGKTDSTPTMSRDSGMCTRQRTACAHTTCLPSGQP